MPDTSSLQRQLYGLVWPAFAENVLQTALGVVSLVLVGRLGTEAVAAVGLANQIYFLTVTLLMGLAFVLFGDQIFRLYGADEAVRERGRTALLFLGLGQAPQAIAFVLAGALRGAGDTRWTLLGGLIGTCGLRALVAYGLGVVAGVGYPAIWLAWLSDWLMRSALFVWRFRSGRWARARV